MAQISTGVKMEIKNRAKDYMTAIKGNTVTDEDIMIAENLIMFGYLKAKEDEVLERIERNNQTKETQAIISSEWK